MNDHCDGDETDDCTGKCEHIQCIIHTLPSSLSDDERARATDLITRNADLFSTGEFDIGITHLLTARIDTGNSPPISEPLRRHPKAHLEVIDKAVEDLERAGLVEQSCSLWSSNLVIVSKADSPTPHITVDLRRLNEVTCKEAFPMPLQSEALDFLSQSKYLCVFDVSHGFFNVPLHPDDHDKTSFLTRKGQYHFRVLPQGARNSPAIFSRIMSLTLRGLNYLLSSICR